MEERSSAATRANKITRKTNKFLPHVIVSLIILIFLQLFVFENKWQNLDTHFGTSTWEVVRSMSRHISSTRENDVGSELELNASTIDAESEAQIKLTLKRTTTCIPWAFAEKGILNSTEVECMKDVVVCSDEQNKFENAQSAQIEKLKSEMLKLQENLQNSVTMMQLKDTRESGLTNTGINWFMSSLWGKSEAGKPEEFRFPSKESQGRILCLQGNHTSMGVKNFYGFAWKDHLPQNAKLLRGLTLVADNYWDYVNPWHSMSALINFITWRSDNGCLVADRIIAYHWGEMVTKMGDWITNVMHASMGKKLELETLGGYDDQQIVCLEDAIVNRRGLGGMSLENMNKLFDTVRCKVHKFCKIEPKSYMLDNKGGAIDITIVARTGPREFKNLTGLVASVTDQCNLVNGCRVEVIRISNLSFCEQVELMSKTDILVTSHGAQLTNMIFMPKGGSVMEMFPKGWLELAGVGQYIYSWLTNWSGLYHEGAWRDPEGPDCPYDAEKEKLKCFLFHKDQSVGLNQTHLSSWTAEVLRSIEIRREKLDVASRLPVTQCSCDEDDESA